MPTNEMLFLVFVVSAFSLFALVLGYQSFAEWRAQRKKQKD